MMNFEAFVKFEMERKSQVVRVNDQTTNELYNCSYKITKGDVKELLTLGLTPVTEADEIERRKIVAFFNNAVTGLKDVNSRQLVYQPKYDETGDLAACLSCLQLIVREGFVDLHVFVRSQNYKTNFMYDNQTFALVLNAASNILGVPVGTGYVKVTSLHYFI